MHEMPIDDVELTAQEMAELAVQAIADIKDRTYGYLQLWSTIQTADSRYTDICHALSLATLLSPAHTRKWLVITDRVRLMREEYYKKPDSVDVDIVRDIKNLGEEKYRADETALHIMSLEARTLDFMVDIKEWSQLNGRPTH